MSALFIAAGPNIRKGVTIAKMRNIDVAPTIMELLGVPPAPTVSGSSLGSALLNP